MDIFRYTFLGVIQGLTEFMPVSSSGHLVIAQRILPGVDNPGIILEVFLHAGTLLSVLYYFRKSILKKRLKYWIFVGIATIPAILVGLFLNSGIEKIFENVRIVGVALIVTGLINFATTKLTEKGGGLFTSKDIKILEITKTFIIGVFQAFAIIPGISRSGSTIFAGRKLGLSRKEAAEFSFLMSIPAILGANVYQLMNIKETGDFDSLYVFGFIASFVSGVYAIRVVLKLLEKANYIYFCYYAFALGLLIVIIS